MCKRKGPNFFDVRKYIQKCRLRSDQKSGACKQVDVSLLEYEMTILRTAANDFSSFLLVCDKNNFFSFSLRQFQNVWYATLNVNVN